MRNDLISRKALMQSLRGNVLVDVTPHLEDAIEEQPTWVSEEKAGADVLDAGMAADITQAIKYFEDELSQMKVFAEMIAFREKEKKSVEAKSMETALKVLRGITENRKGQQARKGL